MRDFNSQGFLKSYNDRKPLLNILHCKKKKSQSSQLSQCNKKLRKPKKSAEAGSLKLFRFLNF